MSICKIMSGFLLVLSQTLYAGQILTDLSLVSDYIFRGKTKTDHSPAVRAGMGYAFDFGFSFGASAGNVGADDARGMEGIIALDYVYNLNEIFSLMGGGKFYHDPFSSKADTSDYSVGIGISKYLRLSAFYSPSYFAAGTDAKYLLAEMIYEVLPTNHIFIETSAGYNKFDIEAFVGNKNYIDYKMTIHQQEQMHDIGIFFVGTNRRIFDGQKVDEPAHDFGFGATCTIKIKS